MTLVKFANGKKDNVLNPLFNDVFESLFNDSFSDRMVSRVPAVNIAETDTNYQIELAVPGLKKSDFKISLNKQILTVRSDREAKNADEEKKYNKREYSFTSFICSFTLPDGQIMLKSKPGILMGF